MKYLKGLCGGSPRSSERNEVFVFNLTNVVCQKSFTYCIAAFTVFTCNGVITTFIL